MHQPIEPEHINAMRGVGDALAELFKPAGFCLLVFPLNDAGGRMNYIANANREDMLTAMKEFIANMEGRGPDSMLPTSEVPH